MAPLDGLLLKPVLAACFCGRWRTCMGRTAADHRRRGFKRRTSASRGSEALPRQTALEAVLPHGCAQKFDGRSAEVLDDDHERSPGLVSTARVSRDCQKSGRAGRKPTRGRREAGLDSSTAKSGVAHR